MAWPLSLRAQSWSGASSGTASIGNPYSLCFTDGFNLAQDACFTQGGNRIVKVLGTLNLSGGSLSASFFSSGAANPAGSGLLRFTSSESPCWRNAANNADLCLSKNEHGEHWHGAACSRQHNSGSEPKCIATRRAVRAGEHDCRRQRHTDAHQQDAHGARSDKPFHYGNGRRSGDAAKQDADGSIYGKQRQHSQRASERGCNYRQRLGAERLHVLSAR